MKLGTSLWTIRGQLVILYLGVLAVLLIGLGIFQSVTLSSYLRQTTETSVRGAASREMSVLGPCFIRSAAGLRKNAAALAGLLGSHDTAVDIVGSNGAVLASHAFGTPGASQPFHPSRAVIASLIRAASPQPAQSAPTRPLTPCPSPAGRHHEPDHYRFHGQFGSERSGGLLLVAIPLGSGGATFGYAVLGRSMSGANATVRREQVVFALSALAALVLAAIVALPLINRALNPLRRVARAAQAIAGGDLEQRANLVHTHDEVGQLGHAFDTMVDRLESALSAAVASEARMRRFVADASHELRTPLTVLQGTAGVLLHLDRGEHPEFTTALRNLNEEAERLSRLVNDLLTLSRIDAKGALIPQPVPVQPFLQRFVEHYGVAWPERRIILDTGDVNGATAQIDPDALRRVLTNLIDNAARYTTPGTPITVGAAAVDGTVTVEIRDEGPGLAAEDATHIFERFYRADVGRSRRVGGSGLGLAIVDALVEQSGGTIRIDTAPDRGTTVSISLQAAPAVKDGEGSPASDSPGHATPFSGSC